MQNTLQTQVFHFCVLGFCKVTGFTKNFALCKPFIISNTVKTRLFFLEKLFKNLLVIKYLACGIQSVKLKFLFATIGFKAKLTIKINSV